MKDSLAKHIAIFQHFWYLHHKFPTIVVRAKEKEKNVGEIGNEGVKLYPNEPLARRRLLKRKRRGTVVRLTFSGRTACPYKV